ncbi:MAG: DUF883 family protein [Verrucomicrobiales bacterium]|nr:DUF883 family protein [Verrucomicrobiales bacterium]
MSEQEAIEESSATENFEAGKSHALQAAEELKTAAAQKAEELKAVAQEKGSQIKDAAVEKTQHFRDVATEKAEHLRGAAEQHLGDAKIRVDELREEGEKYVRENPAKSVLIALGLGFIIGRILR